METNPCEKPGCTFSHFNLFNCTFSSCYMWDPVSHTPRQDSEYPAVNWCHHGCNNSRIPNIYCSADLKWLWFWSNDSEMEKTSAKHFWDQAPQQTVADAGWVGLVKSKPLNGYFFVPSSSSSTVNTMRAQTRFCLLASFIHIHFLLLTSPLLWKHKLCVFTCFYSKLKSFSVLTWICWGPKTKTAVWSCVANFTRLFTISY